MKLGERSVLAFCALSLLVSALAGWATAEAGKASQVIDSQAIARWNNVRVVDGTKFPQTGAGIQAAIKDIGPVPGAVLLPPGTYDVSSEIRVTQTGLSIIGFGHSSQIRVTDATTNVFNVSGSLFLLADVEIIASVRKTAGSIIVATADQGTVRNVRLTGEFWNGFTLDTDKASNWSFDAIRVPGGVNWNNLFHLQASGGTVASTHVHNLFVSNTITWRTAAIVLDTGVDTFIASDNEIGGVGTIVSTRNSLGGQAPRWIRFLNTFTESGVTTGTALDLQAARDFRYQGYIGSSLVGANIGTNARGVDLSHIEFVNIGREAIKIGRGALDVEISHNTFEETGNQADGTYDTIFVAAGTTDFKILFNVFKSSLKNRPRYNISVAPGASDRYQIVGNRFWDFRRGGLKDGGTGANRWIAGNQR